ncbi:hypothetical protein [Actinomadura miaoliensis]|uniref:Uncharacterized protein n=1 Tax=Actinomadura miaoliensis TaxID=430685 RepID=A0ABP7WZU6_9ACTN
MPSDAINQQWLDEVLTGLGETADQVAAALHAAKITGQRHNPSDCPMVRYVAARARERVPSAQVTASATRSTIQVEIDLRDADPQTVWTVTPQAVREFIDAFDDGEYTDLVDETAA